MSQEAYEFETPDGVVNATKTIIDEFPQKVTEVEQSILDAIDANVSLGPAFVSEFVPDVMDPDLKDY
ncbi:MAG: hypothetical protein AAFY56_10470, partial [Pseudomonadota bacterium]